MIEHCQALADIDATAVARLHCRCLPNSLVSMLGETYARSLYHYMARSQREALFLARASGAGKIVGACALSLGPATLDRRLVLGSRLIPSLALRPHILLAQLAKLSASRHSARNDALPRDLDGLPEVLTIFADPAMRGRGVGAALLEAVERFLVGRGYRQYMLKTLDEDDNRAFKFYFDHGFIDRCRHVKRGRRFRVLEKHVGPGDHSGVGAGS